MSDAIYERYKDALRRGHIAAAAGRHDRAIAAYAEAAGIATDRATPLVGLGGALRAAGRDAEALAAFDAAIERAPDDETALRGRAELLVAAGDRSGAAESLDALAVTLDRAGHLAAATETAVRALELAESRARRSDVRAYVGRLRDQAAPDAVEILAHADRVLGGGPASAAEPEPEPEPEPVDPVVLTAELEAAVEAGDDDAARVLALQAFAAHRAAGTPAAAIDACYLALPGSPFDTGLHLALAELYLDLGWRAVAADKLVLLGQLADLGADADAAARICALATTRLPDEPRLAARCS